MGGDGLATIFIINNGTFLRLNLIKIQGRTQDLAGGAKNFFFRFRNLHVAKRHAAHDEVLRFVTGVKFF